ncbi:hypothetical protein [Carboxylicivirga taeanensis]|uniref:hypothetical protein n=1 Tax=Carboxylicivirga taeanensis TaxID=1416875 RepID=UPI003F6E1978
MKPNKHILIATSIFFCLIAFLYPFVLFSCKESWSTILSLSFTSLSAIATVLTLIVAIILYQRFSIDSKFIERQADKTLELVEYLNEQCVHISEIGNKSTILSRFIIMDYKNVFSLENFKTLESKNIAIKVKDYEEFIKPIMEFRKSHWLPAEIKTKLNFLDFKATSEISNNRKLSEYASLYFNKSKLGEYEIVIPYITITEYLIAKDRLIMTIKNWLSKHCDVKLDLELELKSNSKK